MERPVLGADVRAAGVIGGQEDQGVGEPGEDQGGSALQEAA